MKNSNFSQKGSVLLEAVVALGVIAIIMTAMAVITTVSLSNATFIKNQNLANKYAQEGIDYVRFIKDSDYLTFKSNYLDSLQPNGNQSVNQLCFDNYYDLMGSVNCPNTDPVTAQGFHRDIYLTRYCGSNPYNPNSFQVQVIVSWQGGKCSSVNRFCHKADVVSCLSVNPNQTSL